MLMIYVVVVVVIVVNSNNLFFPDLSYNKSFIFYENYASFVM